MRQACKRHRVYAQLHTAQVGQSCINLVARKSHLPGLSVLRQGTHLRHTGEAACWSDRSLPAYVAAHCAASDAPTLGRQNRQDKADGGGRGMWVPEGSRSGCRLSGRLHRNVIEQEFCETPPGKPNKKFIPGGTLGLRTIAR